MGRMRVVQVANFYGPRSGGLRTAVDRLGAEYCAAGHEVYLIVPGPAASRTVLASGVIRISVPAMSIPFTGGYRAVLPAPVRRLVTALDPDALEVSDRLTLRSMGRWGRRQGAVTVHFHERLDRLAGLVLPPGWATRVADFANRRTASDYDMVVCTTGFAREEFDRIHAPNVQTVPLGVDLDTFHPRKRSARLRQRWATPGQTLLVHCGRLSVEKRVDRSIDALAALRDSGVDAQLLVVGEGPLRAKLERHAAQLPVNFTGFVDNRSDIAALLASADVALAPGPHETFGLAALEALACGTPAVVSRTSALREIVTPGSGAHAADDPRSIARGVVDIISRPARRRRRDARRRAGRSRGREPPMGCSASCRRRLAHTLRTNNRASLAKRLG